MLTIFSYFFSKSLIFSNFRWLLAKNPYNFYFLYIFDIKKYIFILTSFCCQKRNKKIKTKSMFVKIRQALRRWTSSSSSTLSSSLSSLQSVSHTCIEIVMNNIYYVLYNSLPLSLYFEHFYFSIYFILKSAYSWQVLFWFFAV